MKICVATVAYRGWRGDEIDEAIEDASSAEYRYIEIQNLPGNRLGRVISGEEDVANFANALYIGGLEPVTIYVPPWGGPTDEAAKQRAKEIQKFLEVAKRLKIKTAVSTDHERVDGGIGRIIITLKELEPYIAKTGINLGLEPHYKNRIEQISDYDEIFATIKNPQIGICLDTGHFHSAKVDTVALIRKYPDRIFHAHIKDHIGTQSVPFGTGETDNLSVIKELEKIGYKGYLSVELEVEDKSQTPRYVREAREYLEKLIQEV